jgi:hypothetical protein
LVGRNGQHQPGTAGQQRAVAGKGA